MKRRHLLNALTLLPVIGGSVGRALAADAPKPLAEIQNNWQMLLAKNADVATSTSPIQKTEEEWKKALPPPSFNVLRKEGTEYPGSSPLDHEKRAGVFVCMGCTLPLFTSQMKFDSGTGWPSFFTSIPEHLAQKTDFMLIAPRTEYHCVRCGGHQGHVFNDGPKPTGQRWCNNGVALKFIPTTGSA